MDVSRRREEKYLGLTAPLINGVFGFSGYEIVAKFLNFLFYELQSNLLFR